MNVMLCALSFLAVFGVQSEAAHMRSLPLECTWSKVRSVAVKSLQVEQTIEHGRRTVNFRFPFYAEANCPSVSQDKRHVAFLFEPAKPTREGGGLPAWDSRYLVLYDTETRKRLTLDASPNRWYRCRLSPDGKRLLAIRQRAGQTIDHMTGQDMVVVDTSTGKIEKTFDKADRGYDWFDESTLLRYVKIGKEYRFQTVGSKALPTTVFAAGYVMDASHSPGANWIVAIGALDSPVPTAMFLNVRTKQVWATDVRVAPSVQSYLPCAALGSSGFMAIGQGSKGYGFYLWSRTNAQPAYVEADRGDFSITSSDAHGRVAVVQVLPMGAVRRFLVDVRQHKIVSSVSYQEPVVSAVYVF